MTQGYWMSDYSKSILDLSSDTIEGIDKVLKRYLKSAVSHQDFKALYYIQVDYLKDKKRLPWSIEDYTKAFSSKNFFKDYMDCGSWVEFRHYQKSDVLKLHNANFCKRDKICAPCAVRRAYKQQLKFMSIIEEDKEFLKKDWCYIVIPIKHNKSESYTDVMNRVISMRKKITQAMRNSRKGISNGFWSNFDGGMYSQEVTRSGNGWNVHLNLILNSRRVGVGASVEQSQTAPNTERLFDIKTIRNRRGQISHQNEELRSWLLRHFDSQMHNISFIEDNNKLNDEIVEVLKYSLKFSALSDFELFEVFVKSVGVRMFGTFGNLWGKGLEDVTLEGDEVLSEDFEELIFTRTFDKEFYEYGYKMYKRELKENEKKEILFDHTFGLCLKNLGQYNKDPMIIIPLGNGKTHIKYKGRKDGKK